MKVPKFVSLWREDPATVRAELLEGLEAARAHIAPKYFYDALGSRLFEAITALPEYDLARTEAAIFDNCAGAIASHLPRGATFVDLGAGNCAKAARLFGMVEPSRYIAVDLSVEYLRDALGSLQMRFPELDMIGAGLDYTRGITSTAELGIPDAGPRLLFYPGSSIGNFTPPQALELLRGIHAACGTSAGSGLLLGVDLAKAKVELDAAYDDALGVTAAFNRNVLRNVNRLIGADFALQDWRHVAFFNEREARVEMHLEAVRPATVRWPGGERRFAAGERIHTENSCKWSVKGISQWLADAGFARPVVWTDPGERFAVLWAPAR